MYRGLLASQRRPRCRGLALCRARAEVASLGPVAAVVAELAERHALGLLDLDISSNNFHYTECERRFPCRSR